MTKLRYVLSTWLMVIAFLLCLAFLVHIADEVWGAVVRWKAR